MMFDIANNSNRNITFFFVITSLYSATKLFYILLKDGELIYLEKRNSSTLWHKMWSFIVLFVILCFVAIVTVIFILNKSIIFILPLGVKLYALMYKIIYNSLAILIVYGIIITVNRFICPIKKSLLEILVGSFVTLIISVMGSIGFVLYLHYFVSYDNLYGSLASIIIFMLWAYILTFGLSLGNVVTKILIENRRFYEQYFRNKKLYKNLRRY